MRRTIMAYISLGLLIQAMTGAVVHARPPQPQSATGDITAEDILTALDKLKAELLKAQKPNGSWEEAAWSVNSPAAGIGGQTALVTWALLQAGQDPYSEPILKAVQHLLAIERQMNGTYNRSLRCMVLSSLARIDPAGKYAAAMQRDVEFLLSSRLPNGRWTYVPMSLVKARGMATLDYGGIGDNSNTQFAVLALREAAVAGASVPTSAWQEIRDYWQRSQGEDGGFSYRDPGSSYGSMTGAGAASLFIAEDMMRGGRCCVGELPVPISRALGWLSQNFNAAINPNGSDAWRLYWLYSVERVAETSGYRYFGNHDWFWEGASVIVRDVRRGNGPQYIGEASLADRAFALIFLAKSVSPVIYNKLQFAGAWDPNPLDAAHMTRYLSTDVFERHLNWQIIRLEAPLSIFHEAPVLLITSKTWPARNDSLTDQLRPKLYQFCESGGTVLIDHTCRPDKDFKDNLATFLDGLWPGRRLRVLPPGHPLYAAQFPLDDKIVMKGMGNGCREYVLVCEGAAPQAASLPATSGPATSSGPGTQPTAADLSCTWQKSLAIQQPQAFRMAANILMYATDKTFRNKLEPRSRLARSTDKAPRTLTIAHVQHPDNWNPCPLALPMLSEALVPQAGLDLAVSNVKLDGVSRITQRVLLIDGRGRMDWTSEQVQQVRRFITAGGAVFGEALMGNREFAESLRQLAAGAMMAAPHPIPGDDPLITGGFRPEALNLTKVHYSRALRWRKGITGPAQLEGCKQDDHWAFIISPYDLTNGLTTATPFGSLGYEPDDATRIAINCMLYFSETAR